MINQNYLYLKQAYETEFKDSVLDVTEKRAKSYLLYERAKAKHSYIFLPLKEGATECTLYYRYWKTEQNQAVCRLDIRVQKCNAMSKYQLVSSHEKENSNTTSFVSAKVLITFLEMLDIKPKNKNYVENKPDLTRDDVCNRGKATF